MLFFPPYHSNIYDFVSQFVPNDAFLFLLCLVLFKNKNKNTNASVSQRTPVKSTQFCLCSFNKWNHLFSYCFTWVLNKVYYNIKRSKGTFKEETLHCSIHRLDGELLTGSYQNIGDITGSVWGGWDTPWSCYSWKRELILLCGKPWSEKSWAGNSSWKRC